MMHAVLRAGLFFVLILCACGGTTRASSASPQTEAPPLPPIVERALTEDQRVQLICTSLAEGRPDALSEQAQKAWTMERDRDACRLARAFGTKPASDDAASCQQALASAEGLPSGIADLAKSPERLAASFDLSFVVSLQLVEIGDRMTATVRRTSQSFGRLSGFVQVALEGLVAEILALGLEDLLEHPSVRAYAVPTEVARQSCRLWEAGTSRPVITQRLLERSILRLGDTGLTRPTLADACAPGQPDRPVACDRLATAAANEKMSIDAFCRTTGIPHRRWQCERATEYVVSLTAHPLHQSCAKAGAPRLCDTLHAAARKTYGQDPEGLDRLCRAPKLPHHVDQCRRLQRDLARQGTWHPYAPENACRAHPSRCRRLRRKLLDRSQRTRSLAPDPDLRLEAMPAPNAGFEDRLGRCVVDAASLCGDRLPESDGDALLSCVSATCGLAVARGDETVEVSHDLVDQVRRLRGNVEGFDGSLDGIQARIEQVDDHVDDVAVRVDARMSTIRGEVHDIQETVADVPGRTAGLISKDIDKLQDELRRTRESRKKRLEQVRARLIEALAKAGLDELDLEALVSVDDEQGSVVLGITDEVAFANGRHTVRRNEVDELCSFADALNATLATLGSDPLTREWSLVVVGRASETGFRRGGRSEQTNMLLSAERATEVYDWLTTNNEKAGGDRRRCDNTFDEDRVHIVGRGDHDFTSGSTAAAQVVILELRFPALARPDPLGGT